MPRGTTQVVIRGASNDWREGYCASKVQTDMSVEVRGGGYVSTIGIVKVGGGACGIQSERDSGSGVVCQSRLEKTKLPPPTLGYKREHASAEGGEI
ncbi:hypothetical protein Tco_0183468 [Tanacetum coccineum]